MPGQDKKIDGKIYNLPLISEIAALILKYVDFGYTRYIIVEKQNGRLKRIDELHHTYLPL